MIIIILIVVLLTLILIVSFIVSFLTSYIVVNKFFIKVRLIIQSGGKSCLSCKVLSRSLSWFISLLSWLCLLINL